MRGAVSTRKRHRREHTTLGGIGRTGRGRGTPANSISGQYPKRSGLIAVNRDLSDIRFRLEPVNASPLPRIHEPLASQPSG